MKNTFLENFLSIFLEIDRIIFWHLAKIFPQSWQKYFLSVQTNTLIKIYFFEKHFFILFSDFERDIFWLPSKSLQKVVKTVFYPFRKQSEVTEFFEVFFFGFWYVFGVWAKVFWHLANTIPQSWQNCFLGVQSNTLMKKKDFRIFFSKFGAHFFLNFSENIPQSWQNCFYAFRRTLWWKTIF